MATRDLTVPYLRLRSALHRKAPGRAEDGRDGLLSSAGGPDSIPGLPTGAPPVYVEMVNDVSNDVNSIQSKS